MNKKNKIRIFHFIFIQTQQNLHKKSPVIMPMRSVEMTDNIEKESKTNVGITNKHS